VTFTCNAGYVPSRFDTTCQLNRAWLPNPSCTYVSCELPSITDGYYTNNRHDSIYTSPLPYGANIQPHCSSHCYTPSPATARTCQDNGHWSGSEPSCIPTVTCNSLPTLTNGNYDDGSNTAPYYCDEDISPKCHDGYYMVGSGVNRRCIANEKWSGENPSCERITCSAPKTVNNGVYNGSGSVYNYGTILVLTCDRGYYISNNAVANRKCVGKDRWSANNPICHRIRCGQPYRIDHGQYNINNQGSYDFGTVITPICNKGYTIANNVTERVCEEPNRWSSDEPQCTLVTCIRPTSIENGVLTPNQHTYDYNTWITLRCNAGYEVKGGIQQLRCLEDGSWGAVSLQCVKIVCNDTTNVQHESINTYPNISFGEPGNVTYNSSFFHLKEGSTKVNCSAGRKLVWTKPPQFGRCALLCHKH